MRVSLHLVASWFHVLAIGLSARWQLLMRCELLGGNCLVSDNGVVSHAVARSSYCAGLWDLLDVQIGCATRAMAHWTRDNFGYYLNVFPVLCQLVASARNPKVARAMLFKMERLLLYNKKHPDIITFFAENCMTLRETVIENWHSILTHNVNRNVAVVTHDNYEKATCIAQQCWALRNELKEKVLKKKAQPAERLGLLQRLESKAFKRPTRTWLSFCSSLFGRWSRSSRRTGAAAASTRTSFGRA